MGGGGLIKPSMKPFLVGPGYGSKGWEEREHIYMFSNASINLMKMFLTEQKHALSLNFPTAGSFHFYYTRPHHIFYQGRTVQSKSSNVQLFQIEAYLLSFITNLLRPNKCHDHFQRFVSF
jgi:hypothetical protein